MEWRNRESVVVYCCQHQYHRQRRRRVIFNIIFCKGKRKKPKQNWRNKRMWGRLARPKLMTTWLKSLVWGVQSSHGPVQMTANLPCEPSMIHKDNYCLSYYPRKTNRRIRINYFLFVFVKKTDCLRDGASKPIRSASTPNRRRLLSASNRLSCLWSKRRRRWTFTNSTELGMMSLKTYKHYLFRSLFSLVYCLIQFSYHTHTHMHT